MTKFLSALLVCSAAVAQPGCLVANTDCESDSDCESGRVCESGSCVDSGSGGDGGSSSGGGSGGTAGTGGGQPSFTYCYECANAYCQEQWDACDGPDITFCSNLVGCLDECTTSACSSNCTSQWGFGSTATSNLRACLMSNCWESCMN